MSLGNDVEQCGCCGEYVLIDDMHRDGEWCKGCVNDCNAEQFGSSCYDDPHGDRDPSPEQLAGEIFEDRLALYRNEY